MVSDFIPDDRGRRRRVAVAVVADSSGRELEFAVACRMDADEDSIREHLARSPAMVDWAVRSVSFEEWSSRPLGARSTEHLLN